MDTRDQPTFRGQVILPLLFLAICLVSGLLAACSGHSRLVRERDTCKTDLQSCDEQKRQTAEEAQNCQRAVVQLEKGNRALLEDLAAASAEREDLARSYERCKRSAPAQDARSGQATDTYRAITERLSQEIQEGAVRVDQRESRLKLNLVDKILFPSGSASLTQQGQEVLRKVGNAIKDTPDRRIVIEGHTDDQPLGPNLRERFRSNWDLSALRATAVVTFLQEKVGIDPALLSATGYSMYQPLVENDTPEHREMNRRIEIVLVPLTPQELHKRAKTPGILGNPAAPHTAPAGDRGSSSAERNL